MAIKPSVETVEESPTQSGGNFLPPADNAYELGSESYQWKAIHTKYLLELRPFLDYTEISGQAEIPTTVYQGLFTGHSLPIWDSDQEQLYYGMCVPDRWDGESDIDIHVYCYLASAQDTDEKAFKLQIEWEHHAVGAVIPDTGNIISVLTENLPNPTAQFTSYKVIFTGANAVNYDVDGAGSKLLVDENLVMRLRRIAKSGDDTEITGELVITHIGLIFHCDKVGAAE